MDICDVVSKTVDGPKTGYTPNKDIKKEFFGNTVPDFLANHTSKEVYQSKRALGHLFRQWKTFAQSLSNESYPYDYVREEADVPTIPCVDHNLQAKADDLWHSFVRQIDNLKYRYRIKSDLHLFVARLPETKKSFDLKKQVRDELRRIGKDIRYQFHQQQESNNVKGIACKLACYRKAEMRPEVAKAFIMCLPIATQHQSSVTLFARTGHNIVMQSPKSSGTLKEFLAKIKDKNITQEVEVNDWLIVAVAMVCEMYKSYHHDKKELFIKDIISAAKDINAMANSLPDKGGFLDKSRSWARSFVGLNVRDICKQYESLKTTAIPPTKLCENLAKVFLEVYLNMSLDNTSIDDFNQSTKEKEEDTITKLKCLLVDNKLQV